MAVKEFDEGLRLRRGNLGNPQRVFGEATAGSAKGTMYKRNGQLEVLGKRIMAGDTLREAARKSGSSSTTATKLYRILTNIIHANGMKTPQCECGRLSIHTGWCFPRLARKGGLHHNSLAATGKLDAIIQALRAGEAMRAISRRTGRSLGVIRKYQRQLKSSGTIMTCGCGRTAGHRGRCFFLRLAQSIAPPTETPPPPRP